MWSFLVWSRILNGRATLSSGSVIDYQHELGIIDRKFVPGSESTSGRAGVVVYWHVDDVNAELDRAVAMGARQLEAPQDRGQGFITATVVDPFGNILGIMYNPHYVEILASFKRA
jgi:predicted enzyme related to lactoylglutathione lyase